MAHAEFHEVLPVNKDQLLKVITAYEKYPGFVEGCKAVEVDRKDKKKLRVQYHVNMMSKDFSYTLVHKEDLKAGRVEWSLIESNLFKKNTGRWELKALDSQSTDVRYTLEVEFKIPVPGFILNRLVKNSLPGMIKNFEKKATQLK